jgi:uncharacterized coiled-coil DUF342 family protein
MEKLFTYEDIDKLRAVRDEVNKDLTRDLADLKEVQDRVDKRREAFQRLDSIIRDLSRVHELFKNVSPTPQ